jgi:hypothetical protein
MIIWGSKARMKTIGKGQFHCPTCRQQRAYEQKIAKRYFTLYFIPLFPIGDLGEFVECQTCRVTFKPEVLNLKPPKPQPNVAELLNSVKRNLEGGLPIEYVTRDLVAAGVDRDVGSTVVNSAIGEKRKVCRQCNLSYAENATICQECQQPLSEKV